MWDFDIGRALALMGRTLPFILLSIAVYAGIAIAYVLATGISACIGWGIGGMAGHDAWGAAAVWGGVIRFGLVGVILYWLCAYILYVVEPGHTAVLVALFDGKTLPAGRPPIDHARRIVAARFTEVNVLFAIDQFIKGVLAIATGLLGILPLPGMAELIAMRRR
jgi:hypothetical protein